MMTSLYFWKNDGTVNDLRSDKYAIEEFQSFPKAIKYLSSDIYFFNTWAMANSFELPVVNFVWVILGILFQN